MNDSKTSNSLAYDARVIRCLSEMIGGYGLSYADSCFMKAHYEREATERKARRAAETADAKTGFHWRDGWYFKRLYDGSVRASQVNDERNTVSTQITIPPNDWASIVCFVSRDGETRERWIESQEFHDGKE